MNLTIRILGCEVLAIDTTPPSSNDDKTDVTTAAFGFTSTTPLMTDGRYGCDD